MRMHAHAHVYVHKGMHATVYTTHEVKRISHVSYVSVGVSHVLSHRNGYPVDTCIPNIRIVGLFLFRHIIVLRLV